MTWYEIYDDCYINLSSFWKFEIEQAPTDIWCIYGFRGDGVECLVKRERPDELHTILKDMMVTARAIL